MGQDRARRLAAEAIRDLRLDLRGLTVLTEAASGHFEVTPLIAALAGGRVIALTRDSVHASAASVKARTELLAREWRIEVEVVTDRHPDRFAAADIVTNLGFVRPIDKDLIAVLKPTAVIPLMWETWEYRPADLDLAECARRGILVLGTNERVPELHLFDYVGLIPVKLGFDLGLEIAYTDVAVAGSGDLLLAAVRALERFGARITAIDLDRTSLAAERGMLERADLLVLVEHRRREQIVGPDAGLTWEEIASSAPTLAVAHICGAVDADGLRRSGLRYLPREIAPAGYMSVTTAYLGPAPVVRLHTAGLKVGEAMARARLSGFSTEDAAAYALRTSPAMSFAAEQLRRDATAQE